MWGGGGDRGGGAEEGVFEDAGAGEEGCGLGVSRFLFSFVLFLR